MALKGTIYSKVAGVSHNNPDGESRQDIIEKYCKPGAPLILIPEPDNEFSDTAVAIWVDTSAGRKQVGYVRNTDLDDQLFDYIQGGGKLTSTIQEVTGGGEKTFGVNIKIDIVESRAQVSEGVIPVTKKRPAFILVVLAGFAVLCFICIIGSLAMDAMGFLPTSTPGRIPTNKPATGTLLPTPTQVTSNTTAKSPEEYLAEYGGDIAVYQNILSLTDCSQLQEQFDLASENNARETAGTPQFKWTLGYMQATDQRMKDFGCY